MKKIFLLLSFIVFTVFISCQTESEPEIFTGVDSITIVNKSDTKLTIESVETFDSLYGDYDDYNDDYDYDYDPDYDSSNVFDYNYDDYNHYVYLFVVVHFVMLLVINFFWFVI